MSPHDGKACAYLRSEGPVATLASDAFEAPATGRLALVAYLRVADPTRQPPLRMAIEGQTAGRAYYRYTPLGGLPGAKQPLAGQWSRFVFSVDDFTHESGEPLRVRFDLMGPGEVWIDSVRLFDTYFHDREHLELLKLVQVANVNLQDGRLADCSRMLQSYWPRFLERHVPDPVSAAPASAPDSPAPTPEPASPEPPKAGWLDRAKDYLPRWMRY
jgi:hypothetical protein